MLIAVLSDVHANLTALEAAFRLMEEARVDAAYCLGDVVGYGPDPGPCVDLVRAYCAGCVRGNHDEAVAGGGAGGGTGGGGGAGDKGAAALRGLPPDGREAARLHRTLLTEDQLAWLGGLPLRLEAHGCLFVHASPDDPGAWHRLETFPAVRAQFDAFTQAVCFVGHSHRPAVVSDALGVFAVRPGHRFLIDVGSVGQPRDHDPRLAFGLFDTEAFRYEGVRAHYDVEETARRVEAAGLPAGLAGRLRLGV